MRLPNGYGGVVKLSGNRRRPYAARITTGWHQNDLTGKYIQHFQVLGYAPTRAEALQLLASFNKNPLDGSTLKLTFSDIYERWSEEKFSATSLSNVKGYRAAYAACEELWRLPFRALRLDDLQHVVDTCGKNYPTLKKMRVLFNQLYAYAIKHELVQKDYSEFVDIAQYKDKNPNHTERGRFSDEEIARIWAHKDDRCYQTILMLLYNGVRVSELLDLKKENVHLKEQYFDVVESKTKSGIRSVPIADKVLPFYENWYGDCSQSPYLIHTTDSAHYTYQNYYKNVFRPLVTRLGIDRTPHCCRHTTISMLADAHVDQTTIKKIVGHTGAMSLTERVYTHPDIRELIDAINKI